MMTRVEKEGEGKREERRGEREREKTQTWSPNTCALARTALEITIGCLCQGPSRRFQGACRFSTHKNLPTVGLFGPCFNTGRKETRKKTRARELVIAGGARNGPLWRARTPSICGMNPVAHAFSAASGSSSDTLRTIDAHTFFDEALRDRDAHHGAWVALAVLVGAQFAIEICFSCGPSVGSNHPNRIVLVRFSVIPAEELLVGEHHKGFKCCLPRIESTPTRCSTSRQKFSRANRVAAVNRGARAGLKHRACGERPCNARHSVERDMSSELCRRIMSRVWRGVSVTAVSISAKNLTRSPPLQRTGLVWSTTTQLLELRLDALQRPVWLHRTHYAWFFGSPRATGAAEQRPALPSQRHDPWCTEGIKSTIQRLFEQSSASIIIVMTRLTCTRRAECP